MGLFAAALRMRHLVSPGTPAANTSALYFNAQGILCVKGPNGIEREVSPPVSQKHTNASFDSVTNSTAGPFGTTVASRPLFTDWIQYWTGGGTPYAATSADDTQTSKGFGYSAKVTYGQASKSLDLDSTVFDVVPGALIEVTVRVRGDGPRGFITIMTGIDVTPDWFTSTVVSSDSGMVTPGSTWVDITHSMVVPAGHNKARFKLRSNSTAPAAPGSIWFDESTSKVTVIPPSGVVTGEIKMWPDVAAPTGYLLCQGGTFSATTYPVLAALLGDRFGVHSGDNYYLPDFRARSPIGVGGVVVPAAGTENYSVGQKWGDSRMPQHNHGVSDPGHVHYVDTLWSSYSTHTHYDYSAAPAAAPNPTQGTYSNGGTAKSAATGITVQNAGAGTAANVHPVLGVNFIIKAA